MLKRFIFATALCLLAVFAALAADVTGKWTAQVPGRSGQTREQTFNLKADGQTLTGTVSGRQGDVQISNGKIDGDKISFTVAGGQGEQKYTGTVSGDEIKFKREGGQGAAREFTAKRAK
jgi:hypothetical protein